MPVEYCGPMGSCGLGEIADGVNGFALIGEMAGDESGHSVAPAGDINGDGIDDFVVGAWQADPVGSSSGKSYVVFGSSEADIWSLGSFSIDLLTDGTRGFALTGESGSDRSGHSVAAAGDINADGVGDLAIGAYLADPAGSGSGKTYLIFGSDVPDAWSNGPFSLGALADGVRGFVLTGEVAGDQSGYSVASAGDINGDGVDDLVVGSWGADPAGSASGKTYVIFGSNVPGVWLNATFSLGLLADGERGFALSGELATDNSGHSVAGAGDVNGDGIDDLIVGARQCQTTAGCSRAGKSYVVFGSNTTGAWSVGSFSLGVLVDGVRGFALTGEAAGDISGWSVAGAGDVNGDGIGDLIVGAWGAPARSASGKSYVIFGSDDASVWVGGSFSLGALADGVRGFALTGEIADDRSGYSVAGGGDFNGDGLSDLLIGAYQEDSGGNVAGKSYIIFGSNTPTAWLAGTFSFNVLMDGVRGFALIGETASDRSGYSVAWAGDINDDGLSDLLIGAIGAVATAHNGRVTAVFGVGIPKVVANQLTLMRGEGIVLTGNYMRLIGDTFADSTILIAPTEVQRGQFEWTETGFIAGRFFQKDVNEGAVRFVHDNSPFAPSYQLAFFDRPPFFLGGTFVSQANLTYLGSSPVLTDNVLSADQGQKTILSSLALRATDADGAEDQLVFVVKDLQYGQFDRDNGTFVERNITRFTQQSIIDQTIQFIHDGSSNPPSYRISVDDGKIVTDSEAAIISFNYAPVMILRPMIIDQGQPTFISPLELSASDEESFLGALTFEVANVLYGGFSYASNSIFPIIEFSQSSLVEGNIQFSQNASDEVPRFSIRVSDGSVWSAWQNANITLNHRPQRLVNFVDQLVTQAVPFEFVLPNVSFIDRDGDNLTLSATLSGGTPLPQEIVFEPTLGRFNGFLNTQASQVIEVSASDPRGLSDSGSFTLSVQGTDSLKTNNLSVDQGQSVILTLENLSANSGELSSDIVFQVSEVTGGQFDRLDFAGQVITQAIDTFTQQEIELGRIQFIHDGSVDAPAYKAALGDGITFGTPQLAGIVFNTLPVLTLGTNIVFDQGTGLIGSTGTRITSGIISATDAETALVNLLFEVKEVVQGQFEYLGNVGLKITEFPQLPVMQGGIIFVQDGTEGVPSFAVRVTDGHIWTNWQNVSVTLNHRPQRLVNFPEQLVTQAVPFTFTLPNASFVDSDGDNLTLSATLSGGAPLPREIIFEASAGRFTGLLNTQASQVIEVSAADLRGLSDSGSFTLSVQGGTDVLRTNSLSVDQGQSVILTLDNLSANSGQSSEDIVFQVSEVTAGQFNRLDISGQLVNAAIDTFTQQEIELDRIQFAHDGSASAPTYKVALGDGITFGTAQLAGGQFNAAPLLTVGSEIILDQGTGLAGSTGTRITSEIVSATDAESSLVNLLFEVKDVAQGQFEYTSNPGLAITEFPQLPVMQGGISFIQDGSDGVPSFSVRVSDGSIWTDWQTASVTLNHRPVVIGTLPDQTVIEGEAFAFGVNTQAIFEDSDGDALVLSAGLKGGLPLPEGVKFDPAKNRFAGEIGGVSTQVVEVTATDPRGLSTKATFSIQSKLSQLGELRVLWDGLAVTGGAAAAVVGYFLWRRRAAEHRNQYAFANQLRKLLNLQYHDFSTHFGDAYKTKVDKLLAILKFKHNEFYDKLNVAEQQSFIACVANILETEGFLSPAETTYGVMAWLLFFSRGWPNALDLARFEKELSCIAQKAVTAWQQEAQTSSSSPITKWPVPEYGRRDKLRACCSKLCCGHFWRSVVDVLCCYRSRKAPLPGEPMRFEEESKGSGEIGMAVLSDGRGSSSAHRPLPASSLTMVDDGASLPVPPLSASAGDSARRAAEGETRVMQLYVQK